MVERRRSLPNISFSTRDSHSARIPGGAEALHRPNTDRLIKSTQDDTQHNRTSGERAHVAAGAGCTMPELVDQMPADAQSRPVSGMTAVM